MVGTVTHPDGEDVPSKALLPPPSLGQKTLWDIRILDLKTERPDVVKPLAS